MKLVSLKIFIFLSILFIFTLFFGSISVNASITNLIIDNKEISNFTPIRNLCNLEKINYKIRRIVIGL